MTQKNLLAQEVADDLLFRTGKALMTDDADAFMACLRFPQIIESLGGTQILHTRDEMRQVFEKVRRFHRKTGVTNIVRTLESAEFFEPDSIAYIYVSQHLKICGTPTTKPYPTLSTARFKDGEWKIEASIYAALSAPSFNDALENCA